MSKDPMVKVGQVWRDNDPRNKRSRIGKVIEIHTVTGMALVEWQVDDAPVRKGPGGRRPSRTWCKLARFSGQSRGYGLVEDVK